MEVRIIFIPKDHFELFLPWLDVVDCGDSIELFAYNHNEEGCNLEVTGEKAEVEPFMNLLIEYLTLEVC